MLHHVVDIFFKLEVLAENISYLSRMPFLILIFDFRFFYNFHENFLNEVDGR